MKSTSSYRLPLVAMAIALAVVLCPLSFVHGVAQLRDFGTRRLVLDNDGAGRITIQTQPTITNNYSIALPTDTVGAHRGLLLFTNAGSGALTTSFLGAGANGQVLTIVAGTPTWTTAQNWLTTGNSGLTSSNFLGTTDAVNLQLRTNNVNRLVIQQGSGFIATNPNITAAGGYNGIVNTIDYRTAPGGPFVQSGTVRGIWNSLVLGPGGPNLGTAEVTSFYSTLDLQAAGAHTGSLAGYVSILRSNGSSSGTYASYTGFLVNDNLAGPNTISTHHGFRESISGGMTITNKFGLLLTPPSGAQNYTGIQVDQIPTSTTQRRRAFFYNATSENDQVAINARGYVSIGDTTLKAKLLVAENGAFTNGFHAVGIQNLATSTTNSINKVGLSITSTGAWTGTNASNIGLQVSVSGGTTNYAATLVGGNVGIGTTTPALQLEVTGTSQTANVRMGSLSGAAIATAWTPGTNDGIVVADNNGDLLKRSVASVLGSLSSPYEEATAFQRNIRRRSDLVSGPAATPGYQATDLQAVRSVASQTATGNNSTITGGSSNTVSGQNAGIMSGLTNTVSSNEAFIGGGESNTVGGSAIRSAIVAGGSNTVSSNESFIGGGTSNTINASALRGVIGGGTSNLVGANYGAILGGQSNTVNNQYGAIWGGQNLTLSANSTAGYNGGSAMTIATANTAILGNVNLWLGRNDNTVPQIRLYRPTSTTGAFPPAGVTFIAFQPPSSASANDQTYTLPNAIGTANQVLRIAATPAPTSTTATLEWATETSVFEEVTASQGNIRRRVAYTSGIAGAPVGQHSNDFQGARTAATQTASGNYSVVAGGQNNTVAGNYSMAFGHGANVTQNNTIVFNHPGVGDGATRVGIDIDNPQVALDVDGGFVVRPPVNVDVNANGATVTPGNRSYLVLNPNGANRTGLILAAGLQAGQVLILRILQGQPNSIQIPDAAGSNVNLSGAWVGNADDTITLLWSGTLWVELSRSNN